MSLVPFHVAAGVLSILVGFTSLFAAKGGRLHRRSGLLFVYAMLVMALSGAVMAVGRASAGINVPAGLVTAYLVFTSLATVRPSSDAIHRLDRPVMLAACVIGAAALLIAMSGAVSRAMAYPLVIFGLVALFGGAGDHRMIRAGGLKGAPRLRRHLWRMCTALFIAAGSFFLGPARRIPERLRPPAFRLIPFVALATMAYWLWRYHRKPSSSSARAGAASEAISL